MPHCHNNRYNMINTTQRNISYEGDALEWNFFDLFFLECAATFPWRQRWRLPITLWLHLLQGLNLKSFTWFHHFNHNLLLSGFAFDCFLFQDGRSRWGAAWKGRCTCWSGCKAEGGTSQHPQKEWIIEMESDYNKSNIFAWLQVLSMFWEHPAVWGFPGAAGGWSWGGQVGEEQEHLKIPAKWPFFGSKSL